MRALWRPLAALLLVLSACAPSADQGSEGLSIDFERFQLENGLDVVLHVDRSDPIAAVAMTFHVGSAKEVPGKTGFAHLFEHLFFLDSENLGPGGLDRLMTRVGSSTNGSTSRDRTNYFEVVPVDGLEKALWAEADKLGFFINTVSESVVAKEKQVVKNEKRQAVDNNPYGHNNFVLDRALYPEGHPYSWQVIGSLDDLESATLADTKEFHSKWYGPNNATLVVAGDIDLAQVREWIETYFGEIPSRPMPEVPEAPPVSLQATVSLFHEDNFARLPQLTLAWPTVPLYHPDSYALNVLARLLTDGKTTPFYQLLVEEDEVAPAARGFNSSQELAGRFTFQIRAFAETDLDDVHASVGRAFHRFDSTGVIPEELKRVKAGTETAFYRGLSSTMGKAFQVAQYAIFAGSPDFVEEDLQRTLDVTAEDVQRVYETYLKDQPFVATSFVPRGSPELALEGAERAQVVEEPIVQGAEGDFVVQRGEERNAAGSFDRSVEPPYGESPTLKAPAVWQEALENGLTVWGVEDHEIPLVQFELRLKGGLLLDSPERTGVANLLAESMTAGTASRTPEELEQAIDLLGASINVSAGQESFVLSGSTLARTFDETMELVEEILLEPRFDEEEFGLAKTRMRNTLRGRAANPGAVGQDVFNKLLYGEHILGKNTRGTVESLETIGIDDLREYYDRAVVPGVAAFHVAGAVGQGQVLNSLSGIATGWEGSTPAFPPPPTWSNDRAGLYFVDIPGSSQSVLNIGYLALSQTDPDFYPATVMNFRLGGGGFASELLQVLREGKGYTYGISSRFRGSELPGPFSIGSAVRSNITLEALDLIKGIVENHGPEFDSADLDATKSFLLRANAGAFETLGAKLNLLRSMSTYGFPADYVLQREDIVRSMSVEEIQRLSGTYLDPAHMIWLVVGDAQTQRGRLGALGLGPSVLVDREGNQ
jgi:zinc protease